MTDLSHLPVFAAPARPWPASRPWPLLPYVCVVAAGASGLAAGHVMGGNAAAFEAKLLLLLRFMAVIKFLAVLAAAAVVHWRLRSPVEARLATAYLAALMIMAFAPGLIWSLGGLATGALLFHAGLLVFLCLAWKDDGHTVGRGYAAIGGRRVRELDRERHPTIT